MTFRVERRHQLWCVEDPRHRVGGIFVDLAAAIRFIRQYHSSARIVLSVGPDRDVALGQGVRI